MPPFFEEAEEQETSAGDVEALVNVTNGTILNATATECSEPDPILTPGQIALHVIAITLLQNCGKMVPFLFYSKEATWRQRLALSLGMMPRGEVGAAILVIATSLGVTGPIVLVSVLSLALNLCMTSVFITGVKLLLTEDKKTMVCLHTCVYVGIGTHR